MAKNTQMQRIVIMYGIDVIFKNKGQYKNTPRMKKYYLTYPQGRFCSPF